MGRNMGSVTFALLLFLLLSPLVIAVSNDRLVRVGLKKHKLDVNQLSSHKGCKSKQPLDRYMRKFAIGNDLENSGDADIVTLKNYLDAQYFGEIGNESSVDRLMKQIMNFMSDIADEFKIVVVQ
ncbi:hypothetical protein Droror1_Dr00021620 [Drosera rotundifolia]